MQKTIQIIMSKAVIFLMVINLVMSLKAQESSSSVKHLTLDNCINIALEQNPDYQLMKQRTHVSEAALKNANGQYFPQADFSASYNRQLLNNGAKKMSVMGQVIEVPGAEPNSFSTGIGINYNLFDGFNRSNNYKRAQLNLQSSDYNLKAFKNQLINNINKAYVEVIKKIQEISIQSHNYSLGKDQLAEIKAKFEAGAIHIGVVASQEAELTNREFAIVQAENDLNNSKLNLLNLIGMPLNTEISLSAESVPFSNDAIGMKQVMEKYSDIEMLYNNAINNRNDILAFNNTIEAAKLSMESAHSGYYPKLAANAGWSWSNSKLEQFSEMSRAYVGASLSFPLFDQFQTNYQIENAKYEVMQNETELFKLKQNIRNAISLSHHNLILASKQLEIGDRALAAAQKNYDIAKERFNLGSASITDFITANNSFVVAQINRNNAFYNFYIAQREIEYQIANQ